MLFSLRESHPFCPLNLLRFRTAPSSSFERKVRTPRRPRSPSLSPSCPRPAISRSSQAADAASPFLFPYLLAHPSTRAALNPLPLALPRPPSPSPRLSPTTPSLSTAIASALQRLPSSQPGTSIDLRARTRLGTRCARGPFARGVELSSSRSSR